MSDAEESLYSEDLLLAMFSLDSEFGGDDLLDVMWPIEKRADEALRHAAAGYIDGNEVGGSEYALYFYGNDRATMWEILRPILEDSPIPLTRVELWPPGEDAEPTIVTYGAP